MRISGIIVVGLLVTLAGCATGPQGNEKDWFTAWAMSHNARAITPAMSADEASTRKFPSFNWEG